MPGGHASKGAADQGALASASGQSRQPVGLRVGHGATEAMRAVPNVRPRPHMLIWNSWPGDGRGRHAVPAGAGTRPGRPSRRSPKQQRGVQNAEVGPPETSSTPQPQIGHVSDGRPLSLGPGEVAERGHLASSSPRRLGPLLRIRPAPWPSAPSLRVNPGGITRSSGSGHKWRVGRAPAGQSRYRRAGMSSTFSTPAWPFAARPHR